MPVLVLLRHGQSVRNEQSRFTGWTNVDFAPHGEEEARQAGRLLLKAGYGFDIWFTSVLKRAIRTLHFVFGQMDLLWLPEHKTWRLNEQYSGALQGLNKAETAESYEEEQVAAWRRSWDIPPPPLDLADSRQAHSDPRYASLWPELMPRSESLKDTVDRVLPFWHEAIVPALRRGQRVLVAARGNSLRGVVKFLSDVPNVEFPNFELPTALPLVYELNDYLRPERRDLSNADD